jgi:ribosomal protein L36
MLLTNLHTSGLPLSVQWLISNPNFSRHSRSSQFPPSIRFHIASDRRSCFLCWTDTSYATNSPLYVASENGHVEVVNILLKRHGVACLINTKYSTCPLQIAVLCNRTDVAHQLIRRERLVYVITHINISTFFWKTLNDLTMPILWCKYNGVIL